ncbi:hypothetical protein M2222_009298 [Bradyrhizobium elkanii]|nr:hypothetical protein [Bradyrhizobium elkanii]MCW2153817.1 hypothetical protein [Bradyrhizobium elkanii]MCW2380351.1 hypothetical protein [Bradyrhizobium elkanii]
MSFLSDLSVWSSIDTSRSAVILPRQ